MSEDKKVDYLAEFLKHYSAHESNLGLEQSFGKESSSASRTGVRSKLLKEMKLSPETPLVDGFYDAEIAGRVSASKQTLEGYFADNRDSIIDAVPAGGLEKAVLSVKPIESKKGNKRHNELVKAHTEYIATAEMNRAALEGELPAGKYAEIMSKQAQAEIAQEMSANKYVDSNTVNLFAFARAQLIGSSPSAALEVGARLEKGKKEAFESLAKKSNEEGYSLADYTRTNLRLNEDNGYVLGMCYNISKPSKK